MTYTWLTDGDNGTLRVAGALDLHGITDNDGRLSTLNDTV